MPVKIVSDRDARFTPIQSNPSLPIDLKKEPDGDSTQQNHNDMQKEPTLIMIIK